jgi:hypothetical protein
MNHRASPPSAAYDMTAVYEHTPGFGTTVEVAIEAVPSFIRSRLETRDHREIVAASMRVMLVMNRGSAAGSPAQRVGLSSPIDSVRIR